MKKPLAFRFLLVAALAGFVLFTTNGYSQQKPDNQASNNKTITIHVTKEVDGKTIVLDTTIVTENDFDVNEFLKEKGIQDDMDSEMKDVEREFALKDGKGTSHFWYHNSDGGTPDTIIINDRIILSDKSKDFYFNMPFEIPEIPEIPELPELQDHLYFNTPNEYSQSWEMPSQNMLKGMAFNFGLDNLMPFGEMKKMVVKKKRHGKKVVITFEDRDDNNFEWNESCCPRGHRNDENVIIYNNGKRFNLPDSEGRIIIEPDRKVIIERDIDKPAVEKNHKKVVIIKEDKGK